MHVKMGDHTMKRFLLVCALLAWSTLPAVAGGASQSNKTLDIPNAEDLIKHCWDISEEKRASGVTAEMRKGALDSAICLKKEITIQAQALIKDTSITKDEISALLENLNAAYGRLYWLMFNENKACTPSCGTMNHPLHNAYVARAYESILKDIIRLRKEYGV